MTAKNTSVFPYGKSGGSCDAKEREKYQKKEGNVIL